MALNPKNTPKRDYENDEKNIDYDYDCSQNSIIETEGCVEYIKDKVQPAISNKTQKLPNNNYSHKKKVTINQ